tara:strand:- start:67 stop:828 length:762 start_codon:yes stop_codon:yes gene_type:complete
MTDTNNSAPSIESFAEYHELHEWLESKKFDIVIATMSLSAGAKKPGRTIERLKKKIKGRFKGLRITKWEKDDKSVYGVAHTRAAISDVLPLDKSDCPESWTGGEAIFQTDLYLETRKEHTLGNAATVSSIGKECFDALVAKDLPWKEAMGTARIFASGLQDAKLSHETSYVAMLPFQGGAIRALTLPIERSEHGEKKIGLVLKLHDYWSPADIAEHREDLKLDALISAMTPEGYPGPEAFAELTKSVVRKAED